MAGALMARPELRHPFEVTPIHAEDQVTVLFAGKRTRLPKPPESGRLLVREGDLPATCGFTVKPEGACYESLCVPLRAPLVVEQDGTRWIDAEAFADHLDQPWLKDEGSEVWSFGEVPAQRDNDMLDARAPDLEIHDRKGNLIRLADLKGKKALIVTWSSW